MNKEQNHTLLNGLALIALRPASELRALKQRVESAGGSLHSAPVLHRQRLQSAAMPARLRQAAGAEIAIFTSRFAVDSASRLFDLKRFQGSQLAVGASTAAALRRAGAPRVQFPAQAANSEALLAMEALQSARCVWLLSGEGGRGLIDSELARRGCRVERIDLYRRSARRLSSAQRGRLLTLSAPCLLAVSSLEALDAWLADRELAAAGQSWPLLAASPRIAQAAAERGLEVAEVAASARPADLFAALVAYARRRSSAAG